MSRYIVGLCGTHGTGKTTILKGVKEAGYPIVDTSLAREAQKKLGWDTLKRAEESAQNMWDLQWTILEAMEDRDDAIQDSEILTLVERTPADMWAYTQLWHKRLGLDDIDEQASDYFDRCVEMSENYVSFVYIPAMDAIPFVEEPNRADLDSRAFVANAIKSFINNEVLPYYTICFSDREGRAAEALSVMQFAQYAKDAVA